MTKLGLGILLLGCLCGTLRAQQQSTTPAADTPPKSAADANPFPEDTKDIPLMPNHPLAAPGAGDAGDSPANSSPSSDAPSGSEAATLPPLRDEADPVTSPDEELTPAAEGSSSSLSAMDKYMPRDDEEEGKHGKKRKLEVKREPTHQEAASKDIEVGAYYIETKNWKAALSRFESAVIIDPENPDVYWGLAVAQQHLGKFAEAKSNYKILLDFDPDGPHGREARKAMKDPAIASAPDAKKQE